MKERGRHELLQDYISDMLRYYNFRVEKEYEIPGKGRVDVVGFKEGLSIGIEISRTSDALRDAGKILEFNLRYIVTDEPAKDLIEIKIGDKIVKVVYYEYFQNEIRRVLNISPSHPRFPTFDDWYRKIREISIDVVREYEKFREVLKSMGLEKYEENILNTLVRIYNSYKVPVKEVEYRGELGRTSYKHEERFYNYVDIKILEYLKMFRLVFEEAITTWKDLYNPLNRRILHLVGLNDKGIKIAKAYLQKLLEKKSDDLRRIINRYGERTVYVILKGIERIEDKEEPFEPYFYEEHEEYKKDKEFYILKELINGIIWKAEDIIFRKDLISAYCEFLVYYCYYKIAQNFFKELYKLNLAGYSPSYTTKGELVGYYYHIPNEVREFILREIMKPSLEEHARRFGILAILLYISKSPDRKELERLLRKWEISTEEFKEEIFKLNNLGITSSFVEYEDYSPFIIIDEEKFKNYIKQVFKNLCI